MEQHPNQAVAVVTGDVAPLFTLPGSDDQPYDLRHSLAKGPLVLVFYRGDW